MTKLDIRGVCALLQVFDMPRSVNFYRDLLGFEIATRSPTYATDNGVELFHWALLRRAGGTELMLNTAYDEGERPNVQDRVRTSWHDDTRLYFACKDLDGAFEVLREYGVRCSPPTTAHYGMRQLSFHDPDGFGITLQWPTEPEKPAAS